MVQKIFLPRNIRSLLGMGTLLLMIGLAGCNSLSPEEAALEKQISLMNQMADAMEAGASKEEMDALRAQQRASVKEAKNLDRDKIEELREKYEDRMNEALQRMAKVSFKQGEAQMEAARKKFEQQMQEAIDRQKGK